MKIIVSIDVPEINADEGYATSDIVEALFTVANHLRWTGKDSAKVTSESSNYTVPINYEIEVEQP